MEIMASKWSTRKTKKEKKLARDCWVRGTSASLYERAYLCALRSKRTKRVETRVWDLATVERKGFGARTSVVLQQVQWRWEGKGIMQLKKVFSVRGLQSVQQQETWPRERLARGREAG